MKNFTNFINPHALYHDNHMYFKHGYLTKIYYYDGGKLLYSMLISPNYSFQANRIPLNGHLRRKFKLNKPSKKISTCVGNSTYVWLPYDYYVQNSALLSS